MNELGIIAQKLGSLPSLATGTKPIYLDDVAQEFRQDLSTFIIGETLHMQDGKIVIGKNLYKKWLRKLVDKGFDYEIRFSL